MPTPYGQIEPEDWRTPVTITTSAEGTEWLLGGLIIFVSGTADDRSGAPAEDPDGDRSANLVHNTTSYDPNYNHISELGNEYNYTQPNDERVAVVGPTPALLEEGYQLNKYSLALMFPPLHNVTVTCSAPADEAILWHWSCTHCKDPSRVIWTHVRGASIDVVFDASDWIVEKVIWVEALDDNELEYNHTITINHTAQSADATYDSDLTPLTCVVPPCGDFDWSSAMGWESRQNTSEFESDFIIRIDNITFDVIDRSAAIVTFEEVPPLLLVAGAGDDDGDGLNDNTNRYGDISYAPLLPVDGPDGASHMVVAEGARAMSYSVHLTQPPKVTPGTDSTDAVVELRMSASDCNGRLLFNVTSPEYNQSWVAEVYEEKTFSLLFTRATFDIDHNVTLSLLQVGWLAALA
jgi:hypothetical protein